METLEVKIDTMLLEIGATETERLAILHVMMLEIKKKFIVTNEDAANAAQQYENYSRDKTLSMKVALQSFIAKSLKN